MSNVNGMNILSVKIKNNTFRACLKIRIEKEYGHRQVS